jgi:hypothetical protein
MATWRQQRMPAVLSEGAYDAWLGAHPEKAREFLRSYPANWLTANPVQKERVRPAQNFSAKVAQTLDGKALTAMNNEAKKTVGGFRPQGTALRRAGAGGCAAPPLPHHGPQEKFASVATYARLFDAAPAHTCEAARRALLSQGYLIQAASAEQVEGKNFQPDAESHLQIFIRVVCVPMRRKACSAPVLSRRYKTAIRSRRSATPPAWAWAASARCRCR